MKDYLFIEQFCFPAYIGIHAYERERTQTLCLSVELDVETEAAALCDRIDETVDYQKVATRLREFLQQQAFQLVETAATRCAEIVLAEFPVTRVRVRLSKPEALDGAQGVGVVVERHATYKGSGHRPPQ